MSDSNALDQKALLIPGFTLALAALFLPPTTQDPTLLQIGLIVAAVVLGALTVIAGFLTLRPAATKLGPNATALGAGLGLEPADFDLRVVGSLTMSVNQQTEYNLTKSKTLWRALKLAMMTVACVVAARLVGGL